MTTKISDPVPLWWDLMTRLEGVVGMGNVVIAGGAVRDFLLGRPHKDIDVFIPMGSFDPEADIQTLILRALGPSAYITRQSVASYGTWLSKHSDPSLLMTITLMWREQTIQVILLSLAPDPLDLFQVLDRVDFGICQVAYARKLPGREHAPEVIATDNFMRDYRDKTFTIIRADTEEQRDYSRQRYERIRKGRYEDWKLVDGPSPSV